MVNRSDIKQVLDTKASTEKIVYVDDVEKLKTNFCDKETVYLTDMINMSFDVMGSFRRNDYSIMMCHTSDDQEAYSLLCGNRVLIKPQHYKFLPDTTKIGNIDDIRISKFLAQNNGVEMLLIPYNAREVDFGDNIGVKEVGRYHLYQSKGATEIRPEDFDRFHKATRKIVNATKKYKEELVPLDKELRLTGETLQTEFGRQWREETFGGITHRLREITNAPDVSVEEILETGKVMPEL